MLELLKELNEAGTLKKKGAASQYPIVMTKPYKLTPIAEERSSIGPALVEKGVIGDAQSEGVLVD